MWSRKQVRHVVRELALFHFVHGGKMCHIVWTWNMWPLTVAQLQIGCDRSSILCTVDKNITRKSKLRARIIDPCSEYVCPYSGTNTDFVSSTKFYLMYLPLFKACDTFCVLFRMPATSPAGAKPPMGLTRCTRFCKLSIVFTWGNKISRYVIQNLC